MHEMHGRYGNLINVTIHKTIFFSIKKSYIGNNNREATWIHKSIKLFDGSYCESSHPCERLIGCQIIGRKM